MVQSKKQGKYIAVFNVVLCVFCIQEFSPSGGGGGGGGGGGA